MKEFLQVLKRFAMPYRKYLIMAIALNLLSAVLNIFSFASLMPMLNLLFGMDAQTYSFMPWDSAGSLKDIAINNLYYYATELIRSFGPSTALLFMGLFLAVSTMMKTACNIASSAVMIP